MGDDRCFDRRSRSIWAYATRHARTVMPAQRMCCLRKKRHDGPMGEEARKSTQGKRKGQNFVSAPKSRLCDSPEAYCLLRLALCVQQMWERGISEAAQRPATRKWKFKGGKQILIAAVWSVHGPSSDFGPVVRYEWNVNVSNVRPKPTENRRGNSERKEK